MNRPIGDPFAVMKQTQASNDQVDIVAELERDLRSEKKNEVKNIQSQKEGGTGLELPDMPGENQYLKQKAQRYVMQDNVPTPGSRVLGDFSRLLGQTSEQQFPNSGMARNQLMSMAYSTMENTQSEAARLVESQLTYQLAASDFGLENRAQKTYRAAKKNSKFLNNVAYN